MNHFDFELGKDIFTNYLYSLGFKESTVKVKLINLGYLLNFLKRKQITNIYDIDEEDLMGFFKYLERKKTLRKKKLFGKNTKMGIKIAINQFFRSLYIMEKILINPMQGIEYIPGGTVKLKERLTSVEVTSLFNAVDGDENLALRDRALLELIYSSGLRSGEVCNLNVGDVNLENRMIFIKQAKGYKDRTLPIGEVACYYLKLYMGARRIDSEPIFLSKTGRMTTDAVNGRFKKYARKAKIYREGMSTHSLRHSVAIHLLSNGADLREVQELLGHESIETTVKYTNELDEKLKDIFLTYHPRENALKTRVDQTYLERLDELAKELKKTKGITSKERETKRRHYEKQKKLDKEKEG